MSNEIILKYIDVTKKFPGVLALDNVSFEVLKGEIHAIVGENGAGKSTLMKITSGLYQPDSGQIVLNGKPVQIKNAHQALGMGIAIVPQELNLVPEMSVAENIYLNIEPRNAIGMINRAELHRKSKEILATLGVVFNTQEKVSYLSVAEQQLIQIARALANQCKILILDEPTASLSIREKDALFERIKLLNQNGTTILYISHRMEEIFEISDRITVLRDGASNRDQSTN